MTTLNRDAILAVNDISIELLSVPEWGGDVYVKTLTGEERGLLEKQMIELGKDGQPKNVKMDYITSYIAFLALCDEQGKRLFTDLKDIDKLAKKSAAALDRVAAKAQALAAISPADLDNMVTDLKNAQPAAMPIG